MIFMALIMVPCITDYYSIIDSLQVTVLLKECRDIQLRCGSMGYDNVDDSSNIASRTITETEAEHVISEQLVTCLWN